MNLRRKIIETLQPDIYHGWKAKAPFFEGWYFKLVDAAETQAWAVIPGIYRDTQAHPDQAFVMVVDGEGHDVAFHRYPVSSFRAAKEHFYIQVGPNLFAADYLTLNLPGMSGHIRFIDRMSWPISWRAPGIMGWYAWFPMECYHGVVSLDHRLDGELVIGKTSVDFSGGRGYVEKDWGRNFPQTWIWVQANHFPEQGVSLTASIARIPFYGRVFPGFIIGLLVNGRLYRFTTYLDAKLEEVAVDGEQVRIVVNNGKQALRITAVQGATALLHAPTSGKGMVPRVKESVAATVAVQLIDRTGTVLFEGESRFGGMEIEGDTEILRTVKGRPAASVEISL